jgi:hypothetical protein
MGANGSCLVVPGNAAMNSCVDCTGAGGNECTGQTPVCNTVSHTCVRCLAAGNAGCNGATPLCCAGTCVAHDASNCAMCGDMCSSPSSCLQSGTSYRCGCASNAECPASARLCAAGTCGPCANDNQCAGLVGLPFCVVGQCVAVMPPTGGGTGGAGSASAAGQ